MNAIDDFKRVRKGRPGRFAPALLLICLFVGSCATTRKLEPFNTSDPGWQVRQGQALWRTRLGSPEVAGEIIFARNQSGSGLLEFLKNPLPLVSAQIDHDQWQIEFVPEKREFGARGIPPRQLIWLHLLRGLQQM